MKKNILAITFAVVALPLMTFAQANPPASPVAGQKSVDSTMKPAAKPAKVKKPAVKKPAVKKSTDQTKAVSTGSGK